MDYKYKIEMSLLAEKDIEEIFDYISIELAADMAAKNLMRKIIKRIKTLSDMPEMCSIVEIPSDNGTTYRKLIVDNFVIIYSVDHSEKKVNIIRAFHGGRDYEKYL